MINQRNPSFKWSSQNRHYRIEFDGSDLHFAATGIWKGCIKCLGFDSRYHIEIDTLLDFRISASIFGPMLVFERNNCGKLLGWPPLLGIDQTSWITLMDDLEEIISLNKRLQMKLV